MATTLAEVLRRFGGQYLSRHTLSSVQARAWRAIVACRTAVLGGERLRCDGCHAEHWRWHSCRNRHCPQCQSRQRDAWRAAIAPRKRVPLRLRSLRRNLTIHPLLRASERGVRPPSERLRITTHTRVSGGRDYDNLLPLLSLRFVACADVVGGHRDRVTAQCRKPSALKLRKLLREHERHKRNRWREGLRKEHQLPPHIRLRVSLV